MNLFPARWRTKRNAVAAIVIALPLLLFAVIRERQSWLPRTLRDGGYANVDKTGYTGRVFWMPDGKTLLVQTQFQLQYWDVNHRQLSRTVDLASWPGDMNLSRDNQLFFGPPNQGTFCIWDLKKQKQVCNLPLDPLLTFAAGNKKVVTSRPDGGKIEIDTLDFAGHLLKRQKISPYPGTTFKYEVYNWFFSADASKGVVEVENKTNGNPAGIMIFNAHDGKPLLFLPRSAYPIGYRPQLFSSDATMLLIGGDGGCQLYDSQTGKLKISIRHSADFGFTTHWTLPEGNKQLLFGVEGKTIFIWDILTGQLLREINVAEESIADIALSPDGSTLAVSSAFDSVKLYRMR